MHEAFGLLKLLKNHALNVVSYENIQFHRKIMHRRMKPSTIEMNNSAIV